MAQVKFDPLVRQVESEIDSACLSNHLIECNRDLALWTYLAFCEDILLKELMQCQAEPRRTAVFSDHLVNTMKYPIRWIWQHCKQTGHLSREFNEQRYSAAWELHELADDYDAFETAYIYARAGYLNLSVEGSELIHAGWNENVQCEAYDRLTEDESLGQDIDSQTLFDHVASTVRVRDDRFDYPVSPSLVAFARDLMLPIMLATMRLPQAWRFPNFTLGQFQEISSTVCSIAMIHQMARSAAAQKGCVGLAIRDSVLILDKEDLISRLRRYTTAPVDVICNVLDVLTYGSSGLRNLDPALQPLIPLNSGKLAISPALWINLDTERNFCVLANRIPDARNAYSEISEDRAKLLEKQIRDGLHDLELTFWSGKIPGRSDLPDVDLA